MWEIQKINKNPMQNSVMLTHTDKSATPTTDYHEADKLARRALGKASLHWKGYSALSNTPVRHYISQNY